MNLLIVGVDLAQQSDFTALTVIEATPTAHQVAITEPHPDLGVLHDRVVTVDGPPVTMGLRWLERVRGEPYPKIVTRISDLMRKLPSPGLLVVDATGVGRPVIDMLEAAGLQPIAITIHGGTTVSAEGREFRVPKVDLVSAILVAMQTGRLKIAPTLALAPVLSRELGNFKLKFNANTMHESFGAWRESEHDDLVLAAALGVWVAEREIDARAEAALEDMRIQAANAEFDRFSISSV